MPKKPTKERSHWLILILLALAQFMVVLDVSIVNVALPAMQKAFDMNATSLQWIVTAYTLTFGGFLLLGGRAADLFGRRRMFLIGTVLFTVASLADGLAQSSGQLIFFRGLQGLAGAFMSPAALSIVLVTYKEGHERNVALAAWGPDHEKTESEFMALHVLESLLQNCLVSWLDSGLPPDFFERRLIFAAEHLLS